MVNFSLPLTFLKAECNQLFLHARGAIFAETTLTLATHLTTLLWIIWSSYVGIGCQLPSLRTYCRIQCAHCLLLDHFAIRGGHKAVCLLLWASLHHLWTARLLPARHAILEDERAAEGGSIGGLNDVGRVFRELGRSVVHDVLC